MRLATAASPVWCVVAAIACAGCSGRSSSPPPVSVSISGSIDVLYTGGSRTFTASVTNSENTAVTWSVVEPGGGTITQAGVYTAPSLPGTFTVRAAAQADPSRSATIAVPVVIHVGHPAGYEVGVDYHATGADFLHTAFIMNYHQPAVRETVRQQLQGMADRGATVMFTRVWMVTEPGTTDFGQSWRTHFPLTDQEAANLRTYAQDVAAVRGSGGNRLRLWICMLWLGASDYTLGSPGTALGFSSLSAAEFTARVEATTDEVLAAVRGIERPDGAPVVERIYMNGEVMIGARANEDWFLATHYPRFVERVSAEGFQPSLYFIAAGLQAELLDDSFIDATYPILDYHRSMFWIYRSLRFMSDQALPIPPRIDFSFYVADPDGASFDTILARVLDDADAVLPTLGAAGSYFLAETHYFQDDGQRRALGQAIAGEAVRDPRMTGVCFWTTPDGGGLGVGIAYPFAIEDFFPPP